MERCDRVGNACSTPTPPLLRAGLLILTCRECQAVLQGHTSLVGQLQMRGDTLVTGGSDGSVRVWSLSRFCPIHRLAAHDNSVTSLQFDDTRVVSGGSDGRVKVWDLKTGQLVRELISHGDAVWRVAFEDEKCVAMALRSGRTVMEVSLAAVGLPACLPAVPRSAVLTPAGVVFLPPRRGSRGVPPLDTTAAFSRGVGDDPSDERHDTRLPAAAELARHHPAARLVRPRYRHERCRCRTGNSATATGGPQLFSRRLSIWIGAATAAVTSCRRLIYISHGLRVPFFGTEALLLSSILARDGKKNMLHYVKVKHTTTASHGVKAEGVCGCQHG